MWKLSTAIGCVLCFSSIASSASAPQFNRPLPGWALHDQVGSALLDALPDVLSSGVLQAGAQLARLSHVERTNSGHDMGWVWAEALSDAGNRQQVKAMFDAHIPVLVLGVGSNESALRAVSNVFGFASNAAAAVYVRTGNQWRVFSLDIPSASHDVHVAARQLVSDVHEIMGKRQEAPRGVSRGGSEHDNRADADIGERHALPRMDLSETRYASSGNGSSATLNMTVIRDSTTSKDKFVVVAKSSYNMIPHDNGLSGGTLTVPYRYKLSQNFRSADATIAPSLVEQFPLSDNRTDINISDTRVKETTYGFNISREISGGLQGRVPDASTKLKFRFDFSRTYKEEKAIAFSVKDYFLISSSQPASGGVAAQWSIELAPAIFGNKEYFGKKPTIERVTPTMRAASPQTFAIWEFDAAYQGTISLDAQSTIENAKYDGSKVEVTPDSRYQAAAGLTVDLGSAYLTRETAVFIRSEKDNGGCLWDDGGNVVLRTCPDTGRPTFLDEKHAQWRFDGEGRYINRGSGQCMQMLPSGLSPGGHQVITARCTLNNDQHWEWRADRIYSLYNGAADDWRLHVSPGGLVDVRTEDKDRYQDLPKNPFHDLLIPWSNYPSQPVPGVFVPVLTGNQPPIPEDWLRFKAVGPDQTWKITALRQSLMP